MALISLLLIISCVQTWCANPTRSRCRAVTINSLWQCEPSVSEELSVVGLRSVRKVEGIAEGTVKNVFLGVLQDHPVVVNELGDERFRDDFRHNIEMHRIFDNSGMTVKVLCDFGDVFVSEYHPRRSLREFLYAGGSEASLGDDEITLYETKESGESGAVGSPGSLRERFPLCIQYVAILKLLHEHGRVMCDSNSLEKTLEQYLVSDDGRLLLNDMDALPEKFEGVVRCGRRPIEGEFLAPEQRGSKGFERGYDEKSDIYKVPAVCKAILGDSEEALWFSLRIGDMHRSCRRERAHERPSADDLLRVYEDIWREYLLEDDGDERIN